MEQGQVMHLLQTVIETDRIPYRHKITAAKPSILLQLDELSLNVDFVGGISGYLIVAPPCSRVESSACSIVAVEKNSTFVACLVALFVDNAHWNINKELVHLSIQKCQFSTRTAYKP